jgi:formate-dependent nitrite reductase cytochrome c552 subunit
MKMNHKNSTSNQIDSPLPLNQFREACARCYQAIVRRLKAVKAKMAAEFSPAMTGYEEVLCAALNEAEAVAWQTPYPHLLFPVLAEEKAVEARQWAAHQRVIRERSDAGSAELQLAA